MTNTHTGTPQRTAQGWGSSQWLHLGIAIVALWIYVLGGLAALGIFAVLCVVVYALALIPTTPSTAQTDSPTTWSRLRPTTSR